MHINCVFCNENKNNKIDIWIILFVFFLGGGLNIFPKHFTIQTRNFKLRSLVHFIKFTIKPNKLKLKYKVVFNTEINLYLYFLSFFSKRILSSLNTVHQTKIKLTRPGKLIIGYCLKSNHEDCFQCQFVLSNIINLTKCLI